MVKQNSKKFLISKIVAIVCTLIATLFAILSIVATCSLPKTTRINAQDNSSITSVIKEDNIIYYSTNKSIFKIDKKNNTTLFQYSIVDDINTKYNLDINTIRSLQDVGNDKLMAISQLSASGYLFLINKDNLNLISYSSFEGEYRTCAYENDNFVLASKTGKYTLINKYDLSDFSDGIKSQGYYYRITKNKNNNYVLSKNESITTLNIAIKNKDIILISSAGISVMDIDFAYNSFHTSSNQKLWNDEAYINKYGIIGTPDKDEVVLDGESFKANRTYFDVIGQTISGGFLYKPTNDIYFFDTNNSLKSISISQIKKVKRAETNPSDELFIIYENIKFKNIVKTDGCCYYSDNIKQVYVVFQSTNKVARISFDEENKPYINEIVPVEFNIVYISIDVLNNGDAICLFNNSNKSESGVLLATLFNSKQLKSKQWSKSCLVWFIILFLLFAISSVISWLCTYKKGFMKKFLEFCRSVAKNKFVYLAMLPSLLLLFTFCYYPAIASIGLSFFDYTKENPAFNWNNFANYKFIFTNAQILGGFKNMFLFLVVDIITAVIPPLIFAYFLTVMKNKKLSKVLRTLLFIPGIIPGIAGNLIWKEAILGNYGVINKCIEACGGSIVKFLTQSSTARWSLLLVGFPYVGSYIIFYGGMMNIPSSYYEAAELEGLGPWRRFVSIDIPLTFPQIKYVIICSIINSMQNFARVQSITNGAYDTSVPVLEMYNQITEGNYGRASAIASIIFVLLFFATYFSMRQKKKELRA